MKFFGATYGIAFGCLLLYASWASHTFHIPMRFSMATALAIAGVCLVFGGYSFARLMEEWRRR